MVDFTKLAKTGDKKPPATMFETFSRLDRQVSHVELRPSQISIFEQIDSRSKDRDLVVKLNTGGGKTTTGLIYLKHKMDQYSEPVVYLVPTVQLADQVISEGQRIGIEVVQWAAGETYPPEDALRCRAIIVCTYDKFFNGRSTFARTDVKLVPAAIVLDDVHAGIESVRKCFSAILPDEVRGELLKILKPALEVVEPAAWIRIENEDPKGMLEVPHWVYSSQLSGIRSVITNSSNKEDLFFSWPYLSRCLELCRLVVSGTTSVLAMDPPALEYVGHYFGAKHRLFMSASIQDGAALVRELDCDPVAASNPINISGEGSVGERMVIVPSLADPEFTREQLAQVVKTFVGMTNVVILVSSGAAAEFWVANGAIAANGSAVAAAVNTLRSTQKGSFYVFAQRYDGIDLPDAACRLLVIDGLPQGEGLLDRFDSETIGGFVGMRGKVANRVEQGLGRAVRSSSDYCAVLLAGRDLANFVSRRIVLENFSPLTVRQIEIGRDVSEAISESGDKVNGVVDTIRQCLMRDVAWRDYYLAQIAKPTDAEGAIVEEAASNLDNASSERLALRLAMARDYSTAAAYLQEAVNRKKSDRALRGILKQATAKILYFADEVEAMKLQASAYADNANVSRPPVIPSKYERRITSQAEGIASWLREFVDKNGALVELDQLRMQLSYANEHKKVEAAMRRFGEVLGADSSRPEKEVGRGPDNLWVFGELALCVEMKNEKHAVLSKTDAGQLHLSMQWVSDNVPKVTSIYPVIGSGNIFADVAGDFLPATTVFTEAAIMGLLDQLRKLVVALIAEGPLFSEDAGNIQRQLGPLSLLPSQILQIGEAVKQGS
ncbi:MAG TPA: DEAD/DEAH box helicase family protein [Luteimonas sp.]|nr:DEAD/DEAH box helicase family protein [Luteimonas sp.]